MLMLINYSSIFLCVSLHLLAKLLVIGYPSQTKGFSSRWGGYLRSFINKFHNNGYLKVFEVVKISRHTL